MNLLLMHGRTDPDIDMEEWGSTLDLIRGITNIRWTYGMMTVGFENEKFRTEAHKLTGWEFTSINSDSGLGLQAPPLYEGMLRAKDVFYGDWDLS
jgi:hypothetical protein